MCTDKGRARGLGTGISSGVQDRVPMRVSGKAPETEVWDVAPIRHTDYA